MSNIYNSFLNAVRVTDELSALQQSARDLFDPPPGFRVSSFTWTPHDKWARNEWICIWAAIGANIYLEGPRSNRQIGRLVLCMDLFREPVSNHKADRLILPHATESLLTCVFSSGPSVNDKSYDVSNLQFDADGWPVNVDNFIAHQDGRLIQYLEPGEEDRPDWTKRGWLFAVPLSSISDAARFKAELAEPFWNALTNKSSIFGEESAACRFPLSRVAAT